MIVVVVDGSWLVDFVVIALDDWAYSVLFDKLAIEDAGAGTFDNAGGGDTFRLVTVVVAAVVVVVVAVVAVVVVGGGGVGTTGTTGGGGTDGTLNLNGSIEGCSGASEIVSTWESSLFVTVLLVRRRRFTDVERSLTIE